MKTVRLILMLFILPVCALAQGAQYTGIAQTARNMIGMGNVYVPIPGASVNVCTGVYTGTACPSGGNVTVYSNQALTTSLTQPLTADNYGNFTFWAAPGAYYFTVTGQGAASSSYQLTLPFGISGTYNATAKSIEQVRYADQFQWSAQSPASSLSAGVLQTVATTWDAIPKGLTSGGVSIVSITNGSPTLTWSSGDKFNPNWTNKPIYLDASSLTIASCASATSCTLTANATYTSSNSWAVIGAPSWVYISGGTGTAEATAVLGTGAECPGGTAASICVDPTNAHSGAYTVADATAGVQEALNDLGGAGVVYVPKGTYSIYHFPVIYKSSVSLDGAGQFATTLQDYQTGNPANPGLLVLNANLVGVRHLQIAGGGSTTGNLLSAIASQFGASNLYIEDVLTDGAAGNGINGAGASMTAAGVYIAGYQLVHMHASSSTYNHGNGVVIDNSQLDRPSQTTMLDAASVYQMNNWSNNDDDGLLQLGLSQGGDFFAANHFFVNGHLGAETACWDGAVWGANYFEANAYGQFLSSCVPGNSGLSFTGNIVSTHGNPANGYAVKITSTSNADTGVSVTNNDLIVNSNISGFTAMIDVDGQGTTVEGNALQQGLNPTGSITNGILLESGSTAAHVRGNSLGSGLSLTNGINDAANSFTTVVPADYSQSGPFWRLGVSMLGEDNGLGPVVTSATHSSAFVGSDLGWSTQIGDAKLIVGDGTPNNRSLVGVGQDSTHGGYITWVAKSTASTATLDIDTYLGNNAINLSTLGEAVNVGGPMAINQGGSIAAGKTLSGGTVNATTLQQGGVNAALVSQLPLSGSVAGSTTSLAANTCGDVVTQAVTGATTTMTPVVTVSGALPTSGLVIEAAVTSANTVSIEYCNVTTGSVVPAAATLEIRVIQ